VNRGPNLSVLTRQFELDRIASRQPGVPDRVGHELGDDESEPVADLLAHRQRYDSAASLGGCGKARAHAAVHVEL
jgi:hypothetical protein